MGKSVKDFLEFSGIDATQYATYKTIECLIYKEIIKELINLNLLPDELRKKLSDKRLENYLDCFPDNNLFVNPKQD